MPELAGVRGRGGGAGRGTVGTEASPVDWERRGRERGTTLWHRTRHSCGWVRDDAKRGEIEDDGGAGSSEMAAGLPIGWALSAALLSAMLTRAVCCVRMCIQTRACAISYVAYDRQACMTVG